MIEGSPRTLIASVALPVGIPATAQWISRFVTGPGYNDITVITYTGTAAATLTMHIVAPGGTPINGNKIIDALPIANNSFVTRSYKPNSWILPAGYSIFVFAGVAAVTFQLLGNEYA